MSLNRTTIKVPNSAAELTAESFQIVTDLTKNYFLSKDLASFPGRVVTLVDPFVKDIKMEYGTDIYDKMIASDPIIGKAVSFLYKSISTFTTIPTPSGTDTLHKFGAAYIKDILDNLEGFQDEEFKLNYDLVRYGASYANVNYEVMPIFGLPSYAISDFQVISPKDLLEVKDVNGKTLGYVPTGGIFKRIFGAGTVQIDYLLAYRNGYWSPDDVNYGEHGEYVDPKDVDWENLQFVPAHRVFKQTYIPTSDFNDGNIGTLDTVIHYWWVRQQILAILLFYSQNYSLPIKKGTLGEGVSVVAVRGADGSEEVTNDGNIKRIEAKIDYLNQIETAGNGGKLVTPHGYELDFVQASAEFISKLWNLFEGLGKEMDANLLLATATTSENASGNSSDSQQGILQLNTHYLKQRKATAYRRLFRKVLGITYPSFEKYSPNAFCGNVSGMPYNLTEIAVLNQADFFDEAQKAALAVQLQFPSRGTRD